VPLSTTHARASSPPHPTPQTPQHHKQRADPKAGRALNVQNPRGRAGASRRRRRRPAQHRGQAHELGSDGARQVGGSTRARSRSSRSSSAAGTFHCARRGSWHPQCSSSTSSSSTSSSTSRRLCSSQRRWHAPTGGGSSGSGHPARLARELRGLVRAGRTRRQPQARAAEAGPRGRAAGVPPGDRGARPRAVAGPGDNLEGGALRGAGPHEGLHEGLHGAA